MTGSRWIDHNGVTRYGSLAELPYWPLVCLAQGHAWNDPPDQDGTSRFRCTRGAAGDHTNTCGREKSETQDRIGVVVSRNYSGGVMLVAEARPLRNEARAELRRRKVRARKEAQAAADADSDLELRAALEQHRREVNNHG